MLGDISGYTDEELNETLRLFQEEKERRKKEFTEKMKKKVAKKKIDSAVKNYVKESYKEMQVETRRALGGAAKEYIFNIKNWKLPTRTDLNLPRMFPRIKRMCFDKEFEKKQRLRIMITYHCKYKEQKQGGLPKIIDVYHSNKASPPITQGTDILQYMIDDGLAIDNRISEFEGRGSGLIFIGYQSLIIQVARNQPAAGSAFVKTPAGLSNQKCSINIQNKDDRCFAYAMLYAKYHTTDNSLSDHPERPSKYSKYNIENEFKWSEGNRKIEFPMKIKDMAFFEKLNPEYALYVYGYEEKKKGGKGEKISKSVYPLYISENKNIGAKKVHMALLEQVVSEDIYNDYISGTISLDRAIELTDKFGEINDMTTAVLNTHYIYIKDLDTLFKQHEKKNKQYHC